jgi:hypothetical protein
MVRFVTVPILAVVLAGCSSSSGGGAGSGDSGAAGSGQGEAATDALTETGAGDDTGALGPYDSGSGGQGGGHADGGHDGSTSGDAASSDSGRAGDASLDSAAYDGGSCNSGLTVGTPACNACVQAQCCSGLVACDAHCQYELQCALTYASGGDAGLASGLAPCNAATPARALVNCISNQCSAPCP